MLNLALWLKRNNFRPDQVQAFLPSPMASATAMYHTGFSPLSPLRFLRKVEVVKTLEQRRLHKAFLRYHDPNNWPMLRAALIRMGRQDLIGNGKQHLVPTFQPAGTGRESEGQRRGPSRAGDTQPQPARRSEPHRPREQTPHRGLALSQHTGLPPAPRG